MMPPDTNLPTEQVTQIIKDILVKKPEDGQAEILAKLEYVDTGIKTFKWHGNDIGVFAETLVNHLLHTFADFETNFVGSSNSGATQHKVDRQINIVPIRQSGPKPSTELENSVIFDQRWQTVLEQLNIVLYQQPEIDYTPPSHRHLLDQKIIVRSNELASAKQILGLNRYVFITGEVGMGKSAMANLLAHHFTVTGSNCDIIYIQATAESWPQNQSLQSYLVNEIAGQLASLGHSKLWERVCHERYEDKPRYPTVSELYDYILFCYQNRQICLVLDLPSDLFISRANTNKSLSCDELITRLLHLAEQQTLWLIGCAHTAHVFGSVKPNTVTHLNSLSVGDLKELLHQQLYDSHIRIDDRTSVVLHGLTAGNPKLLEIAIANWSDTVSILRPNGSDTNLLLQKIFNQLSENQKSIFQLMAVFGGYEVSEIMLSEALSTSNIADTLYELEQKKLIERRKLTANRVTYRLDSVLQTYAYQQIIPEQRRKLHHHAAGVFERLAEREIASYNLKAQYKALSFIHYEHYFELLINGATKLTPAEIAEYSRLVDTALSYTQYLLSMGYANSVKNVLGYFLDKLEPVSIQKAKLLIALGEAFYYLQQGQEKDENPSLIYRLESLALLDSLGESREIDYLMLRATCGIVGIVNQDDPAKARELLDHIEHIAEQEIKWKIQYQLLRGDIQWAEGNYEQAEETVANAIVLFPKKSRYSYSKLHAQLSLLAFLIEQGKLDKAIQQGEEALSTSVQLNDSYLELSILNNQSVLLYLRGDWTRSIHLALRALVTAERIGTYVQRLSLSNHLGMIYLNQGKIEEAEKYLISESDGEFPHKREAFNRLTHLVTLHLYRAEDTQSQSDKEKYLRKVDSFLNAAKQISLGRSHKALNGEFCRLNALYLFHQGNADAALSFALQSVDMFQQMNDPRELGISLRITGDLQMKATNEVDIAKELYLKSQKQLEERDLYETARTKASLAYCYYKQGLPEQAESMRLEVQKIFESLDAQRDLRLLQSQFSNTSKP